MKDQNTMTTKHTPGPWKVLENLTQGRVAIVTTNDAPIQAVICIMDERSKACDVVDRVANAKHICAAVNSHTALIDACNGLLLLAQNSHNIKDDPERFAKFLNAAAGDARAALALAQEGAR